jgi:microcystin-dependent protein
MLDRYNQILNGIRTNITSKMELKSISPADVGGSIEETLKYIKENLANIASGTPAGSMLIWPGPESTIPANMVKIKEAQQFFNITDYETAYTCLGGVNSPWNDNAPVGKFSVPYGPEGYSLAIAGSNYVLGKKYGSFEETLDVDQIPNHDHTEGIHTQNGPEFTETENILPEKDGWRISFFNGKYVLTKTGKTGGGKSHNNLSPILAINIVFVLYDSASEVNATLNNILASLPAIILSSTDLTASGDILVPAGTWLKSVIVLVTEGDPASMTINVSDNKSSMTGDMTGEEMYPQDFVNRHYPTQSPVHVEVSSASAFKVKVQLIKYNIQ